MQAEGRVENLEGPVDLSPDLVDHSPQASGLPPHRVMCLLLWAEKVRIEIKRFFQYKCTTSSLPIPLLMDI